MIPSKADSYSAANSFTFSYQGYNYQFHSSGEVIFPEGYSFDSSVLEYVINKSAEALNLAMAAGSGSKVNWTDSPLLYLVFSFYHTYVVLTSKIAFPWVDSSCLYGFQFHFTGIDERYPGYELYGPAYGFSFVGWSGDQIDLVLDSSGSLFGSNPIGNYTFSDDQRDFGIWSDTQIDDGDINISVTPDSSFNDLPTPYIQGQSLHFTVLINNVLHHYVLNDFRNINIVMTTNNSDMVSFWFYSAVGQDLSTSTIKLTDNDVPVTLYTSQINFSDWRNLNPSKTSVIALLTDSIRNYSFNLPGYTSRYASNFGKNNVKGFYQQTPVSGFADIFLHSLSTSPLPDPIVLPVDDPIPVSDIDPDPVVFDPDPGEDPDPVPGIDYPVDPPLPWPVPPVPPIVSGNDDLWPELNITFDLEDGLIDLANPLANFEWPSFSSVISSFLDSIVWVSTIMTALYSGTDFNVLFAVLSVFFIAASLLGLYKWWHK